MRELRQEDSKVEVTGFEARYYDALMNLITLGWYPSFIRRAIADLELREGERILDLGAGTGRNALLMREHIGSAGEVLGLEIGPEMQAQYRRKTAAYPNLRLKNHRIDLPLPEEFAGTFDRVFISFVLHGFVQEKRDAIIANAARALRPGGIFAVLDYNNFDVDRAPAWVRFAIRKVECPLAEDFIRRDTGEMLAKHGFGDTRQTEYLRGYIRLLQGTLNP
jgi:demethylmenaquinone methyltransferase/2-methoxy-6-polyprenyl-1,4-benzoquinol methylase